MIKRPFNWKFVVFTAVALVSAVYVPVLVVSLMSRLGILDTSVPLSEISFRPALFTYLLVVFIATLVCRANVKELFAAVALAALCTGPIALGFALFGFLTIVLGFAAAAMFRKIRYMLAYYAPSRGTDDTERNKDQQGL